MCRTCKILVWVHTWQCDLLSSSPSPTSGISPHAIPPQLPATVPPLFPPIDPSVQCSFLCVHVFSLFITHLWVRTCGISFSVFVAVCWELCSPDSSMFLQTTQTHRFWLLLNIPWCTCATFSQSSLSSMCIPGLCYCKQCCNEHSCTCVLIVERFIVLWIYTQ